jgi:DNA primase large subunit
VVYEVYKSDLDENNLNVKAIGLNVLIINPFSPEAERIVKRHQKEEIQPAVFEHAKALVGWKASGGKKTVIPQALRSGYDEEKDVLAQRLLFLTVALNFTPYSNELRLVKENLQALIKARLSSLLGEVDENRIVGLLSDLFDIKIGAPTVEGGMRFGDVFVEKRELFAQDQLKYGEPWRIKYGINWRELSRIIQARELRFVDLYLVNGLALLSLSDLVEHYSRFIALKVEDHINARFEEFRGMKKTEEIKRLFIKTAGLAEFLSDSAGKSYRSSILQGKAGRLRQENFPPCIKYIISGVETGSRNYAISVLLTSFLSYARAAPRKVQDPKISDYVKGPKVLTDEILPMIYEAAARCSPSLFEDQPGEKLNIHYHLGLGLASQVKLENAGSSRWYFPPNCEKIRRESPALCRPDETCRQIKNPLTYYFVKFKKEEGRGEKGEEENP